MNLFNSSYYKVKPFIPGFLRVAARRWRASRRRVAYAATWPINESGGQVPPGWPGWPDGKRFAVVLTHDVEGQRGFDRCPQLAELESSLGFRSSFNFIPEGEYSVSKSQRDFLTSRGFEIGVHDLRHDGKLYKSREAFRRNADRINHYLREWEAVGFRSGFMLHNLDWLHDLNVLYECSTFDTDPFEPQSDGTNTVFPFWVSRGGDKGYVELSYTLVQDFSLFVVLRERTIDIWKKKLDWIVERGGMVLLDTHPDYMCFGGAEDQARDEYPVSLYAEFLRHLNEKYGGTFWPALPREVASHYCARLPVASRNTRKRVCMLSHSTYESDNRVRRYAETLARRGDQVEAISVASGDLSLGTGEINGVTVHRVQRRERKEWGKWGYALRLLRFLVVSSLFLARRHRRIRYDLIHVHNVPDFLVFAAWYPKWTGAKLILDVHDIVPEFFSSKFGAKSDSRYVRFLKGVEKASAAFVHHVIVSNHLWYEKLISRAVSKEKCSVFLNHVDSSIFYRRPRTRNDGKLIILFPGTFQWHQGLDIAIEAFDRVKDKVPSAELHLYGGGGVEDELIEMARRLGLNGRVRFGGNVSLEGIADVIANADLGVVPKRADSFGNEAYSTKIMEFMSQGVPVVVSRTKIDTYYFADDVVRFFPSGDVQAMADAMLDVIENKGLREAMVAKGYEYADRNSWVRNRQRYFDLVDSLSMAGSGGESNAESAPSSGAHALAAKE